MRRRSILDVTDRITVYLSRIDRALRFSNFLFGRERLGEILDRDMPEHVRSLLRKRDDLVLIEVTDAENAGARNGHAYFLAAPPDGCPGAHSHSCSVDNCCRTGTASPVVQSPGILEVI